ncbi:MAG: UDP-N-acetylmuramoylalanine--D-glutamate ligase [Flavobacteriales bacterium]|nr:UDP-N-acetylmuramoylalanine--D-glutamate ligase [Flavobacteriales bacterium]
MKSLIYGYGVTGKSFERYLTNKNIPFDIFDKNIDQHNKKNSLSDYQTIFCSPGIPKNLYESLKQYAEVITDLDIFFKEDNSIKIGITGTNRKSTTCFHLEQLIREIDTVNLVGNIGNPMLDVINNSKTYSIIELSSFQLDKMNFNDLDYGILLNIAPDHLDYHGSFEAYKSAKEKIQSSKNFSTENNPYELFRWITGKESKKIDLKNLPYRFEKITPSVINDSKSTNSNSLFFALENAIKFFGLKDFVLIVCGDPAKENHKSLKINGPEEILVYGEHKKEIDACLDNNNKKLFNTLEDIISYLKDSNKKNILFSPGYPSGKDYKNFEIRGEHFNSCLNQDE